MKKNLTFWIVQIYLFLMLGVFPLYYQNGYYNMGDAKYEFFKISAMAMLGILSVLFVFKNLSNVKINKYMISMQDMAVCVYGISAVISFAVSSYRESVWIGSHEWYMGLFSQLLFVGIYFAVSRSDIKISWNMIILSFTGTIVFLIAYLHRFSIDPLGLYEGISEGYWLKFLGTIGNANWYSSYICVVLPVMIGIYVFLDKRIMALPVFLGVASAVTQNSDSVYVGMGLCAIFILWFSFENPQSLLRCLETFLIALMAAKFTGFLQVSFPEKSIAVSAISTEITQGEITKYMFCVVLLLYAFLRLFVSEWEKLTDSLRYIRKIIFIFLGGLVLSILLLMWLVSTGKLVLASGFLANIGYFQFGDSWGSTRGIIWKYAVHIFREYSLKMKLFGCGPDALMWYSAEFYSTEVPAIWGDAVLTNVHNEWLNMLVNTGVIGAVSYLSIFIVSIIRGICHWKKNPLLLSFAAAVLGYMGHNFFCFQQVVCTPLIFIIMGMAENEIVRTKEMRE